MHKYTIRLMGDCLVEVQYPYLGWNGYIGAPRMSKDYESKALMVGIHPHWLKEMALIYMHGYNNAVTQETHRGPKR